MLHSTGHNRDILQVSAVSAASVCNCQVLPRRCGYASVNAQCVLDRSAVLTSISSTFDRPAIKTDYCHIPEHSDWAYSTVKEIKTGEECDGRRDRDLTRCIAKTMSIAHASNPPVDGSGVSTTISKFDKVNGKFPLIPDP